MDISGWAGGLVWLVGVGGLCFCLGCLSTAPTGLPLLSGGCMLDDDGSPVCILEGVLAAGI